jgi:hypothetical protein
MRFLILVRYLFLNKLNQNPPHLAELLGPYNLL